VAQREATGRGAMSRRPWVPSSDDPMPDHAQQAKTRAGVTSCEEGSASTGERDAVGHRQQAERDPFIAG